LGAGLTRVPLLGAAAINCFLVAAPDGSLTLVDSGLRRSLARIEAALAAFGGDLRRIVLTHAHGDHVGAAPELARRSGATVYAHALDVPHLLAGYAPPIDPRMPIARLSTPRTRRLPERFARVEPLQDGDRLEGGLTVVHLPGHTRGQIGLLHAGARALLLADALFNLRGLGFGPRLFCEDIALGRRSVRRIAELDFDVAAFGHGPELRDRAALLRFVS